MKQEHVSLDKVIISEPDTTTTIEAGPVQPEQISKSNTLECTNREMSQDDDHRTWQKSRSCRTVSQSSADMSGDSEYTAQYVGTVKLDTGDNVLEELAANLTGLQQPSYVFVKERDIESSDEITKLDGDHKDISSSETSSNENFKKSCRESECFYVEDDFEEEHRTEASKIEASETLNSDCSVRLTRLDPDIVNSLTSGNPTIAEKEDTTELSVKKEVPEASYSPGSRKKRKTKKERDRSRNKVITTRQ